VGGGIPSPAAHVRSLHVTFTPRTRSHRRRRIAALVVVLGVLAAVWLFLAPPSIGGDTTYVVTDGISMHPRIHTGDLALVRPAASYHVGDIVAYRNPELHVVVLHRIHSISPGGRYRFKGDNNSWIDNSWILSGDLMTMSPDATNVNIIKRGKLWKYNTALEIYTCPADPLWPPKAKVKMRRARSFSIQGRMGGPNDLFDSLTSGKVSHKAFAKESDIKNPSPSGAMVFVDESEYVIDDGYFIVDAFSADTWQNYPSSRHNGGGDMSFADGHAEIHKWVGSTIKPPAKYSIIFGP